MIWLTLIVGLTQTGLPPRSPVQTQAPIPHTRTWDGVAGFEDVRTDAETGQITGVRIACGSGDRGMLDSLRETSRPSPR